MKNNQQLFALIFCLLVFMSMANADDSTRQAEVAERGAKVMPFDLAKTQHQFTKTESGGVQRVIVRDAADQSQILLIKQHLQQLAEQFAVGNYSGPEAIHGKEMPGLAVLKTAKPENLQISYQPETDGASLSFNSSDPLYIEAIHHWFNAQVQDHGHDAVEMCHHHHPKQN